MKKPTHGGVRKGAGRKEAKDPTVVLTFRVKGSKAALAKIEIQKILAKYNNP